MTKTKAADTKGRETNNKGRESGKARGQTKKIIKGILGETGKDMMYEERKRGKETNNKRNTGRDEGDEGHKDNGAGLNQRNEGGEEGRGETEKGGGAYQDQDIRGSNGGYSYPLVVPRLGEVPKDNTIVQCTGTDRSAVHYHGTMDNPPIPSTWKAETRPTAAATPITDGSPGTTPTTTCTPETSPGRATRRRMRTRGGTRRLGA